MGLFDFFQKKDINSGVRSFRSENRAMLIDVREPGEFKQGHIPGARNIPLAKIENAKSAIHDKDMPLYVYCQSGSRSSRAASAGCGVSTVRAGSVKGVSASKFSASASSTRGT